MESLAKKQVECYDKLVNLKSNYKKDGDQRKTIKYVENRLDRLEIIWGELVKRDEEIAKLKETNPQHTYFATNYFEQVENYYEDLKDILQSKLEELKKNETPVSEIGKIHRGEDNYALKLIRIQQETMRLLERLLQSIDKEISEEHSPFYYQHKLATIQAYWHKIILNHTDIVASPEEAYKEYLENKSYQTLEDCYHNVAIKLQEVIGSTQRTDDEVKLPRLVLPIFEGDYQHWTAFHDIFLRLIHNNTRLGDAEKMQYLKTHVRKEASSLLQHLTISNANYKTAWQLLNDRFNNKRKICSTHLQILLAQPKLDQENAIGIRKLHDTTKECLHALSNLGIETDTWAPIISHVVIQKLDHESHKLYEQSLEKPRELPTYDKLFSFLETRFQSLESLKDSKRRDIPQPNKQNRDAKFTDFVKYKTYHTTTSKSRKCTFCQDNHRIYHCKKFQLLSTHERRQFIQANKLCLNCLTHKDSEKCYSRLSCNNCKRQHHTLLHQGMDKGQPTSTTTVTHLSTSHFGETKNMKTSQDKHNRQVLLATTLVKARTIDGKLELLRALIDPGSQASFISDSAAQLLALPKLKAKAEVSGLGLTSTGTVRHKLLIELLPRFPSTFSMKFEVLILNQLTRLLPNKRVKIPSDLKPFANIMLADSTFDTPGPIDIIIGADAYSSIICDGVTKYDNGLIGQKTEFGWILSGPIECNEATNTVTSMVSHVDLENELKRFWEIEETITPVEPSTDDNSVCEQHFVQTHRRNADGTYTVKIPFKQNQDQLGDSRKRAMARLIQNEKKFQSNKKLEAEYKAFMKEYISLKHMVPADQRDEKGFFLPHQAVIKEDSSTTKLRVVFDASSKTTSGVSLNDTMHSGPKLQNNLSDIVLRWRKHRYVFTADIEKMYRQIKIHTDDQKYLKVLWRSSQQEPVREYKLTTVTYGTTSAPFLAIRTLQQLANDERETHPLASHVLKTDFYVDDLLTGTDTIREAKTLQRELIDLLASGGFKLRKWTSNQQSLLDDIPEELREKNLLEINQEETVKTLGLYWQPANDIFQFRVNIPTTTTTTSKRSVLSTIAKLYDPEGWLSPLLIKAKLFMQELWMANLDWDSPLPNDLLFKWNQFREELPTVQTIKIPRWINYNDNCHSIELHGFCDASEKAYGAVIYTRTHTIQGDYKITMLTSKTKVAPIKREMSIPRLELCAAILLARLLARTTKALNIKKVKIYAWTDSKIVLAWIQGDAKKWGTFVANRVLEIRTTAKPHTWHYVKSEDNPADCASRGLTPSQLKAHLLWWTGPKWLAHPEEEWPSTSKAENSYTIPEQTTSCATTTSTTSTIIEPNELITRFSNLTRMLRVLSYCRRFVQYPRRRTGYIKLQEIQQTLIQCIRIVQKESFPLEIKLVSQGKNLPKHSKLLSLTPILDNEGILRLGGRLDHSNVPYNQRHPIIIPHAHHFTLLIIRDAHMKTLHGGNQATLAYLRRTYWIIGAKSAVRTTIHNCTTCCRYKGQTGKQLMGNLPAPRVTPSKPFFNTGVDYAGPFQIRVSKGRGTKAYKGYISIFVCLSTRAVHLEAVSDLTTEAFLAAFKRFTARRGICTNMYSDCGTTFIGAKNELEKQFNQVIRESHKEAAPLLTTHGTEWHFIPPASPHFGGLWEAGVKSTKFHLKRIAGEVNFTFEEFSTLLAQIEACLNSRPLCALNNDPNNLEVLTPGHFLIGRPLLLPPDTTEIEKPITLVHRWRLINKIQHDFWKIWSSEYLTSLQQRTKWNDKTSNINIGDIVILKEDNLPPARWALGRIINTHPGTDGLVRVATVKTAKNIMKRPITKICKLPFNKEDIPTPSKQTEAEGQVQNTKPTNLKRKKPRIQPTNIPVRPPLEKLQTNARPTEGSKRIKTSSALTTLLLLNCVLTTLSAPIQSTSSIDNINSSAAHLQITQFKDNPGIYMEHIADLHMLNNIWNTVVYYDLNTYYMQLKGFEQCVEKLTSICNKTITYNYYCNSILTELRHKIEEMHHNNIILHKRNGNHIIKNKRKRAPLEIVAPYKTA